MIKCEKTKKGRICKKTNKKKNKKGTLTGIWIMDKIMTSL